MQPLVALVFHNLPSLYRRNDFLYYLISMFTLTLLFSVHLVPFSGPACLWNDVIVGMSGKGGTLVTP